MESSLTSYNIDNTSFLQAIFGPDWVEAHVCSFTDDPSAIDNDRRSICWNTGYYGPWHEAGGLPMGNQYFDIATFNKENDGSVRRRKALFKRCHVFVLDDVAEKIPEAQAARLPSPTWILRTSRDSYQWGYVLDPSLAARFGEYSEAEICNAQDILIGSDLVPSGKDPGMRGVTRLVRLPDGDNRKASRLVDGWIPFKCQMIAWNPEQKVSLESIIAPFAGEGESLGMVRREAVTEGQSVVSNHPVLAVVDVLSDKGGGKYDVVCPNIDGHTDGDNSGTALWTYPDGRAGIKCHHGSCLDFSGNDLMAWCRDQPGYAEAREAFVAAQAAAAFRDVVDAGGAGEGGQELVPAEERTAWIGQHQILENIVTISEGAGGYFNLETRGFAGKKSVIDGTYTHLTEVMASTWLCRQIGKKTAQGIGWLPSDEQFIWLEGRKLANTYKPPQIVPIRDDDLIADWLELFRYIYGKHWELVAQHVAFTLQFPQEKIRWQVLTVGHPRTGKTLSLEPLDMILGSASKVVDQDSASETWGDVYARKKVIIYEEVANKDKQHFNRLKSKLANSELESLNIKGQGYLEQPNLYSIYMFTNEDDALQFDVDQDKLLVIRAPSGKKGAAFYNGIGQKMRKDPRFNAAVYAWFLDVDVSSFPSTSLPVKTEAMFAMCKASRNQGEVAILSAIKHLDGPFDSGVTTLPMVKKWLRDSGYRMSQDKEISDLMRAGGWAKCMGKKKVGGKTSAKRFWAPLFSTENLSSSDLFELYVAEMGAPFGV